MEEKIDLEKFNFMNSKNECHVELGMHYKSKILLFSFLMSLILLVLPLMDIFNGNIDMIMIIFDLFIALFLLIANILLAISLYRKESIKINSKELIIIKRFFIYSDKKVYDLRKISNIEINKKIYSNRKKDQLNRIMDLVTLRDGVIRFNYESREIRFGQCLEVFEGEYFLNNHINNYLMSN